MYCCLAEIKCAEKNLSDHEINRLRETVKLQLDPTDKFMALNSRMLLLTSLETYREVKDKLSYIQENFEKNHGPSIKLLCSYSHVYTKIYHSADNYLDDFYRIYQLILDTTGTASTIFRFPGGSINSYNRLVYQEVIAEMTRRGFTYYDWNVSAGDAAPNVNAKQIKTNILDNFERFTCPIILMHDGYTDTLHALDDIITGIEAKGYSFEVLTDSVTPVMFSYKD